jgi:hypothetical protein
VEPAEILVNAPLKRRMFRPYYPRKERKVADHFPLGESYSGVLAGKSLNCCLTLPEVVDFKEFSLFMKPRNVSGNT